MCRTYVEDMIDFKVSDHWRDHYFENGLTPYHSPAYARCRDRHLARLDSIEALLERLVDVLERRASNAS